MFMMVDGYCRKTARSVIIMGPQKIDESHSSMMAQLFSILYLHFNKHLHNVKSLGFRQESMEAKGDSIEAHKYLLGCVYSEEFITQTLTILRKKKKKETLQHSSCHDNPSVEVFHLSVEVGVRFISCRG